MAIKFKSSKKNNPGKDRTRDSGSNGVHKPRLRDASSRERKSKVDKGKDGRAGEDNRRVGQSRPRISDTGLSKKEMSELRAYQQKAGRGHAQRTLARYVDNDTTRKEQCGWMGCKNLAEYITYWGSGGVAFPIPLCKDHHHGIGSNIHYIGYQVIVRTKEQRSRIKMLRTLAEKEGDKGYV